MHLHIKKIVLATAACLCGTAYAMTPGTYTGEAQGRNGEVKVEVTVDANKILSVKVLDTKETAGIGTLAESTLPAEIVAANTVAVDSVSGATLTSAALINAVKVALKKADAGEEMFQPSKSAKATVATDLPHEADVVIVGGGGAGLVAAVTAVDQGAKVIVLEKMAMLGGNTARSEGNMGAVDPEPEKLVNMTPAIDKIVMRALDAKITDPEIKALQDTVRQQYKDYKASKKPYIFDTPELYALQTLIGGNLKADPKLVVMMAKESAKAMQWLDDKSPMTWNHKNRKALVMGIGALYPRAHYPMAADGSHISTYDAYIGPLADHVKAKGSHIITEMKVVDLLEKRGRIVGVIAQDKHGQTQIFRASKGVVLATGGYGANKALVEKYNKVSVHQTSNAPGTTGEVMEAAMDHGAATTGMTWLQIHPHGNPKTGELMSNVTGNTQDTPYVNKLGQRFADETGRRDDISYGILNQPDHIAFSIYDQRQLDMKKVRQEPVEQAIAHGYEFRANTLEELARMAGIDPEGLKKAIEEYNAAVRAKDSSKLHVAKSVIGLTVEQAPFYAVPITPTIHNTMGGLKINTHTQVLDENGKPIPGLYAAGEVTGGVHGANRLGTNALTDLLVFGHHAGLEVSK